MDKFFYPKSMVIVGVSITKMNLARVIINNNKVCGYNGTLYGIGREDGMVDDVPVFSSFDMLPEVAKSDSTVLNTISTAILVM